MKAIICAAACLLLGTSVCLSQELPATETEAAKLDGFKWLKQFEGTWATTHNGTMKSRVVGEFWVVNELIFNEALTAVQSFGYDKKKNQFVGSWIDYSSSFLWRYTGSLDEAGKKLIMEAEGPDMSDPTKARRYRDSYEFKSEDEIAAVSQMLNDKGEWQTYSTSTMTRNAK